MCWPDSSGKREAGYLQQGLGMKALEIFKEMQQGGGKPDNITFVSALNACAGVAALELGKQVHACANKSGFELDILVGNSLIDMYAKCGSMVGAREVFDKMFSVDVVSWNALIGGYAQQGLGKEALIAFEQMQLGGVKPDEVTFICVLSACSHGGLVEDGCHHFESMSTIHGFIPTAEHYACLVDLLGRAGLLDEAGEVMNKMPIQPSTAVWKALLSACRSQGNVDLGRRVFLCLLVWEPNSIEAYVLLSNICARAGMWEEAFKVRKEMKDLGVKEDSGCSWIDPSREVQLSRGPSSLSFTQVEASSGIMS